MKRWGSNEVLNVAWTLFFMLMVLGMLVGWRK